MPVVASVALAVVLAGVAGNNERARVRAEQSESEALVLVLNETRLAPRSRHSPRPYTGRSLLARARR